MIRNILVLLGPPGSGKGSISRLFVKRHGWRQLSTGNLLREHISNQTEIGKKIDFIMKSGKLVSDEIIAQMVEDWLINHNSESESAILDGFPRTAEQARILIELLKDPKFKQATLRVVRLNIPEEDIVLRLTSRFICQNNSCQAVYSLSADSELKPKFEMLCDECGCALFRRFDDEEADVIRQRLLVYRDNENSLLGCFISSGQAIVDLSVQRPLEQIYQEFLSVTGLAGL